MTVLLLRLKEVERAHSRTAPPSRHRDRHARRPRGDTRHGRPGDAAARRDGRRRAAGDSPRAVRRPPPALADAARLPPPAPRACRSGAAADAARAAAPSAGAVLPACGVGALAVTLVVLGLIGAGAYLALQSVYFIGTNARGLVTLYQGIPTSSPGNIDLYSRSYVSGVSASTIPAGAAQDAAQPPPALRRRRRLADPQPRTRANWKGGIARREPADHAGCTRSWRCCSRCWSRSPRAGPSSKPPRCATTRSTRASCSSRNASAVVRSWPPTATVLARSLPGREGTYTRTYPTGSLFAHPLGYYFTNLGASGLEQLPQRRTRGRRPAATCRSILDQLQGVKPAGDKVITTLVPSAQRVAQQRARRTPRGDRGARPAHGGRRGDGLHPLL